MEDVVTKLKSDRLWALLTYMAVIVVNALWGLNLEAVPAGSEASPLVLMGYAVGAFILGKSLRGTVGGSVLQAIAPLATARIDELAEADAPPGGGPGTGT